MTLQITPAALHDLLTDAHRAMVEHRQEWAGAVLHVLRRVTMPEMPNHERPAGPAEGSLPCPITPAAAVAPLATDAPEPAQAAGGTTLRAKARPPSGGHRPVAVWTDERKALLIEQFPNCTDNQALLEQLAALPGEPIASLKAMMVQAGKMGLRRSAEAQRIIARRMGARGGERSLERQPAAPSPHMTPERLDLFARLWGDPTISVRGVWLQVNDLPGPKLTATQSLYNWAKKLGLPTQRPTLPAEVSEPEPEPVAAPEPEPIEPVKPGDDRADAFDAFAAGQTVRQVAADFGLPVDQIVNWHAEWKATQAPQRAEQQTEARA